MQVVIMSAGKGERLSSISGKKPKGLVSVNSIPIIDRILNTLHSAQLKKIIMVVGYKQHLFRQHFVNEDIKFILNPFYDSGQVLSSFWFCINHLNEKEDLIFCHGDTLFDKSIITDLKKHPGDIVLPVCNMKVDEEAMKYKLSKDGKSIVSLSKTIPTSLADGEFIGLCKISSYVLSDLKKSCNELILDLNNRNTLYFEDCLMFLAKIKSYSLTPLSVDKNCWVEIDDEVDFNRARKIFL